MRNFCSPAQRLQHTALPTKIKVLVSNRISANVKCSWIVHDLLIVYLLMRSLSEIISIQEDLNRHQYSETSSLCVSTFILDNPWLARNGELVLEPLSWRAEISHFGTDFFIFESIVLEHPATKTLETSFITWGECIQNCPPKDFGNDWGSSEISQIFKYTLFFPSTVPSN